MSLFQKITILFMVSLLSMGGISYYSYEYEQARFQETLTPILLTKADTVLIKMSEGREDTGTDDLILTQLAHGRVFKELSPSYASIKLLRHEGHYYIRVRYLDEEKTYLYTGHVQEFSYLSLFLLLDILSLMIFYLILIKLLSPLRKLTKALDTFSLDSFTPLNVTSNNEIGALIRAYNTMGETTTRVLKGQERFLIRAAHELRTPITKARLAAQMDTGEYASLYRKVFHELDIFTDELLKGYKLKTDEVERGESFMIETVLMEALEKLLLSDESEITLVMKENFAVEGGREYAVIVLRNLLDNALRYKNGGVVSIEAGERRVRIANAFSPSVTLSGYGVGLSLCEEIVEALGWQMVSERTEEKIVYSVIF